MLTVLTFETRGGFTNVIAYFIFCIFLQCMNRYCHVPTRIWEALEPQQFLTAIL